MRLESLLKLLLTGLLCAAAQAHALGFGRPPASVPLGATLDFSLPLRLEVDEVMEPECLSADVFVGDRRVSPVNVRYAIEAGADARERLIRVITTVAVEEPIVTVQITAGCAAKVTRRFTTFADPVALAAAPPTPLAVVPAAPVPAPNSSTASNATAGAPEPVVAAAPASATAPQAAAPLRAKAGAAKAPRMASAAKSGGGSRAKARRTASTAKAAPRAVAAAPKLRLEQAEPVGNSAAGADAAASAVQMAMLAASAAEGAASNAAARSDALQTQLEKLLAEARLQRDEAAQLRTRMAASEARAFWLTTLAIIALLALAVALWLAWRWRRAQRVAESRWWSAASVQAAAEARPEPPPPAPLPVQRPAPTVALAGRTQPTAKPQAAPPPTAPEPAGAETGWTTATPPRPVSAEELLDLEQQAEFFVVLGQDESAIDLLVSHIRGTGGLSPLPYLKLLEIYRRRGERDNHDRTRARFNQRFNAYAPEWDTDLLQGRALEDYPQVIRQLQRAWDTPLNAMAELEALLFRKDDGEVFDLPAYREVLLLYSLARDLLDHQGDSRPQIDLLLPISDSKFDTTTPRLGPVPAPRDLAETHVLRPDAVIERPAPGRDLDLDLSDPDARSREVTTPGVFHDSNHGGDSRLTDLAPAPSRPKRRR